LRIIFAAISLWLKFPGLIGSKRIPRRFALFISRQDFLQPWHYTEKLFPSQENLVLNPTHRREAAETILKGRNVIQATLGR
jgi:hypothetical protein